MEEYRIKETGKIVTKSGLKSAFPNVSICWSNLGELADAVLRTPEPEVTKFQIVQRDGVIKDSLGNWVQAWKVIDKFKEYTYEVEGVEITVTKAEQEQAFLDAEFSARKESLQKSINTLFDSEVSAIKGVVTQGEVDSFITQEEEAKAYELDPLAKVPLLTEMATVRGIEIAELVIRVLAHAAAYKVALGQAIGKKHKFEDQLKAAVLLADLESIIVE